MWQFFVVGHDAGHRSFSKNKLLEDIVGTLMFAPLIYPFEPWRIKHNHHHAHTNKCVAEFANARDPCLYIPVVQSSPIEVSCRCEPVYKVLPHKFLV